ncbi:MAG: hypothetical protein ACREOR_09760 [Candidatus Binatia bacterium]
MGSTPIGSTNFFQVIQIIFTPAVGADGAMGVAGNCVIAKLAKLPRSLHVAVKSSSLHNAGQRPWHRFQQIREGGQLSGIFSFASIDFHERLWK